MAKFAKRRTGKQSAKLSQRAVIFGLIDSELKYKSPEQVATGLRYEISLIEDETLRKQATTKLNQKIDEYYFYKSLLQENSEDVSHPDDTHPDEQPIDPVQDATIHPDESLADLPLFAVQPTEQPVEAAEGVSSEQQFDTTLNSYYCEIDPFLGLYAVRAKLSIYFAQWAILRKVAKQNETNYIPRDAALQVIQSAMGCTRESAGQKLRQAEGIFWNYQENRGRYYLRAEHDIAIKLASRIPYEVVENSIAGNRRYMVDLKGTKHAINAALYNAYIYVKSERKHAGLYIASRELLTQLFDVSVPTLRRWEELAGIKTQARYAMQADTDVQNAPKHAYLRRGVRKEGDTKATVDYVEYQLSNAYYPQSIISRANRGSSHKTKAALLEFIETNKPASNGSGDNDDSLSCGLQTLGRLNFDSPVKDNWQAVDSHLRKHQDSHIPHYMRHHENLKSGVSVAFMERYTVTANSPLLDGVYASQGAESDADFIRLKMQFDTALTLYHEVI